MNIFPIFIVLILRIENVFGHTTVNEKYLVQPGEFPYVVTIGDSNSHRKCLGTIVSTNWVLTSCTCGVKGEALLIQHGALQNDLPNDQLSEVSDVVTHPNYIGGLNYCINLIRFKSPIKYDNLTKSVELVPKDKQVPINANAVAVAFSPDKDLQRYNVTVEERKYPELINTAGKLESTLVGTPLFYDGYQVGLFTFNEGITLHYLDLAPHVDWIYKVVNTYEFQDEYTTVNEKYLVQPGEFPYVVTIGDSNSHRKCLGTIVSKYWVMTSCACGVKGEALLIQHGAIQNDLPNDQLSQVSDVVTHPNYIGGLNYCINLLRFKSPIKYDNLTKSVKLVPKDREVPISANAVAVAFSPYKDLQGYNVTVEERKFPEMIKTAGQLETTLVGTPLIYDGYQVGMFTFNEGTTLHYLDLAPHVDWIYKAINTYKFQSDLKNIDPTCTTIPDSNDVIDICCTYPFGAQALDFCVSLE